MGVMFRIAGKFLLVLFPSLIFILAVAIDSCAPSKEAGVTPLAAKKELTTTFKILSLNVRHTLKEKSDVRKLTKFIKSSGAEIVTLQQIERPAEGKTGFDAVKELAKQTEMYDYFGKARFLEGFDSGNALLSIYPVKQTSVRSLPVEKGKVRRSLAFGVVDVGLREVGVASTELDDQSASERLAQVEEIFSIAQSLSDVPLVVCGEFGESLSGKASAKMAERFNAANSLQEADKTSQQHVYAIKNPKIEPLSIEKLKFSGSFDALLVTMRVTQ
jgi:endonuclease/exonuclease/phosphatase family metal-dependent hydrolase